MKKTLCLMHLAVAPISGFVIDVNNYGWLDQYSLNTEHNFIGDEACVPTTSTNALTYLQNTSPQVFGSNLSGVTYADWQATDDFLINLMNTQPIIGTYYYELVYGLNEYITQIKNYDQVRFSGSFPDDYWFPAGGFPKPSYFASGKPSIEVLTTSLAGGSATLLSIEYTNGAGGHEILANGVVWDTSTLTGTLYFVDPLDPSASYSPDVPLGPTKQTVGTIEQEGNHLVLTYTQYGGQLPYNGVYHTDVRAQITGLFSVGGAAFTPFANLLENGNLNAIAQAFDTIDATTAEMFPILSVFNLLSQEQLTATFNQLDPSIFNAILYTEQSAALQALTSIKNNLLQYKIPCHANLSGFSFWYTPFNGFIEQKGSLVSNARSGYKSKLEGGATGLDFSFNTDFIAGVSGSCSRSTVRWDNGNAAASINTYGAFLYGAKVKAPLWLDVAFGYTYNHVHAVRQVLAPSQLPFIAPVSSSLRHKNSSNVWVAHAGISYDWDLLSDSNVKAILWPFFSLDYYYASQSGFSEKGNNVLGLAVSKKSTRLLRPEVGVGISGCLQSDSPLNPYYQATFSYVKELRYGGKHTGATFLSAPSNAFTVAGLFPQNDLFCPGITLGLGSATDAIKVQFNYQGAFGGCFRANEFAGEFSFTY